MTTAERAHGWHGRFLRMGSDIDRFWAKVDRSGDCWEWLAHRNWGGYGRFWWGGRLGQAHRFAFQLTHGPIPLGLTIDHLCRNRGCVNPAHLEAVSMRENTLRGIGGPANNARKTHCYLGHPLDEANTTIYERDGKPVRRCRACHRRRAAAYWSTHGEMIAAQWRAARRRRAA